MGEKMRRASVLRGWGNLSKIAGVLILGLFVTVAMVPQTASAAYLTKNAALDNTLESGVAASGTNGSINDWSCSQGWSSTNLYFYKTNSDGKASGFYPETFYLATGANDTNTGLVTYSASGADSYHRIYQSFEATSSAVVTFSLSKVYSNQTRTTVKSPYSSAYLNIAILEGEGQNGNVVWSTSPATGGGYDKVLKSLADDKLGYFKDETGNGWVDMAVNLDDEGITLTSGNKYTLMVTMKRPGGDGTALALTNVGVMEEAVPEPGTWAMLAGLGVVGGMWMRRRKKIAAR